MELAFVFSTLWESSRAFMQMGCKSANMPMETYDAQVLFTDLSP